MPLITAQFPTPLVQIANDLTKRHGIRLYIKRDDLIHPFVSGNKFRKLKYNLIEAQQRGRDTILTFGGAYSNHLYATAAAGAALGINTIGIVRGEEHAATDTATLAFCIAQGMQLHFVSRSMYRLRSDAAYLDELQTQFPDATIIPEGGTTPLSLPGVAEMVEETTLQLGGKPDYFAVATGTGGTTAGILSADAHVLSFSALKGGAFLKDDIAALGVDTESLRLFTQYHFGGYAKHTPELLHFIRDFRTNHGIQLEQVYTGKMLFGLMDQIAQGAFEAGTTIVAVHTGGLQGILPDLVTL